MNQSIPAMRQVVRKRIQEAVEAARMIERATESPRDTRTLAGLREALESVELWIMQAEYERTGGFDFEICSKCGNDQKVVGVECSCGETPASPPAEVVKPPGDVKGCEHWYWPFPWASPYCAACGERWYPAFCGAALGEGDKP